MFIYALLDWRRELYLLFSRLFTSPHTHFSSHLPEGEKGLCCYVHILWVVLFATFSQQFMLHYFVLWGWGVFFMVLWWCLFSPTVFTAAMFASSKDARDFVCVRRCVCFSKTEVRFFFVATYTLRMAQIWGLWLRPFVIVIVHQNIHYLFFLWSFLSNVWRWEEAAWQWKAIILIFRRNLC